MPLALLNVENDDLCCTFVVNTSFSLTLQCCFLFERQISPVLFPQSWQHWPELQANTPCQLGWQHARGTVRVPFFGCPSLSAA